MNQSRLKHFNAVAAWSKWVYAAASEYKMSNFSSIPVSHLQIWQQWNELYGAEL
jgi:hypothetical protein